MSFDEQGKAVIPLDLPNFNGELALMALAWNEQQVGEAERAVKVVAPLVAEIGWPPLVLAGIRPGPWCSCAI